MCPDQGVLSAYLDGELPDRWRTSVDRHVRGCAACTANLAGLRTLSRVLTAGEAPGLDRAMGRVRAALSVVSPVARSRWRLVSVPVPVALAAATLVMALSGALIYSLARPQASLPITVSRLNLEGNAEDITRLLDLLNAQNGRRTVVIDIPLDLPLARFGEPQFRPISQGSME